jgi:hypothetical protein
MPTSRHGGEIADDRALVSGHVARVGVFEHARGGRAQRLRRGQHGDRRSATARMFRKRLERVHQRTSSNRDTQSMTRPSRRAAVCASW